MLHAEDKQSNPELQVHVGQMQNTEARELKGLISDLRLHEIHFKYSKTQITWRCFH